MEVDCVIIGAGMSGMAAAIRLAMYDKKILLVEKHSISGGLNSYYSRGKRKFDVGLHALTNFCQKHDKGLPLGKLLKQLRIPYDEFKLSPQNYSEIVFGDARLKFSNNLELLIEEIKTKFPSELDGFLKLIELIRTYDETNLSQNAPWAKAIVKEYIKDELLLEMIICPLLFYGSAWENDMRLDQFAIMFKALYFEGFSRPEGGVRTIIDILLAKLKSLNVEILFNNEVTHIFTEKDKLTGIELNGNQRIVCKNVLSSIGLPETFQIIGPKDNLTQKKFPTGQLSFCETILVTDKTPKELGIDHTIAFYNQNKKFQYEKPLDFIDPKSAVICFPQNFQTKNDLSNQDSLNSEGIIRLTFMARFDLWESFLEKGDHKKFYREKKQEVLNEARHMLSELYFKNHPQPHYELLFSDVFTPTTIKRYTGHLEGTVYGSPQKLKNGKTNIEGLFICGTDQGFLGIVGAMLSGISMANLHVLQSQS